MTAVVFDVIAQMDVFIIALLGCDDGGIRGPNDPRVPESFRKAWRHNNDGIPADYDPEVGRFILVQPHDHIPDYIDAPTSSVGGRPESGKGVEAPPRDLATQILPSPERSVREPTPEGLQPFTDTAHYGHSPRPAACPIFSDALMTMESCRRPSRILLR